MGHGHRKSHSRAARGATPEVLSKHPKDRYDSDECGSKAGERKRREKRNHKRKRGLEDISKKKHKERHRSSHHSSRSSKRRDKVHRLKDGASSESDSSSGSLSSKEAIRGRNNHRHNDHALQKRSGSPIPDVRKHRSKRMRINDEAFSIDDGRENHDASIKPSKTEELHKCVGSESGKVRQQMKSFSGSKSTRPERERDEMTTTKGQGQGMGLGGRKDRVLEVELRQQALENFMRRRTDGHCSGSRGPASCNEQNEEVVVEMDKGYCLAAGEAVSLDSSKVLGSHMPWNNDPIASTDEKCLAKGNDNNLEEGEIGSDTSIENETGNENASSMLDSGRDSHEKGNIEESSDANRDTDHDLRISNEGELENVRVSVTTPSLSEIREPSKEQALKDSPNVELTSAQHDSNDSFQEKTMSVMRGGEMVQVSYKVYIPKRAAELAARRRLQR